MRPVLLRAGSLRRRLLLGSVSFVLTVIVGVSALMWIESRMRRDFNAATDAFLEEQRIAEEISHAVSRQVMAASLFSIHGTPELMVQVRDAGDEAYGLIRAYLFRDLTPEQRLKLEGVKEAHQRLEVAATEILRTSRNPDDPTASSDRRAPVIVHAQALQQAIDAFLDLRESNVDELRRRQAAMFRGLHLAGGALGMILLGIAIPFAGFVHQRLARPLGELAATADRIEEGDLSVRVRLAHDDELAAVGESFNSMVNTLAEARNRLEAKNRELAEALDRLREAQADLVQTEKLGAVGEMMAGIAHELNNPLASILGYGRLLEQELRSEAPPSPSEIRKGFVTPLVDEASRARELIRSLLGFSRRSRGDLVPVDLYETLRTVERLRVHGFEQAGLSLEIAETHAWVSADPQGLQQVFLNLMNNAMDVLEEQGHGTLRVTTELDEDQVRVTFADDGPGFADPERALDPFFTTKPAGKGTGLGLALVHRFVREFHGSVRAYNAPTGGARVQVSFQRATASPEGAGEAPVVDDSERVVFEGDRDAGGARVLVVEDEAPLRSLQERVLDRLNAQVLVAETGAAARSILETLEVDLIISDVKMPGEMSGLDLFRWVQRERPDLVHRFLFVTGDTEAPHLAEIRRRAPGQVLEKPFELGDYVDRVLERLRCPPGS